MGLIQRPHDLFASTPDPRPPAGLILAAGASSRMGRPKALCQLGGETFVARLVDALAAAGCREVVVVLGAHADRIRPAIPGRARVIHAAEWRRGMRASLRAGLAALPPGPVLLTHVDRPLVAPATLAALVAARGLVIPTHHGAPGHPVRLPASLRPRLLCGDDTPLRDILARACPRHLECDDPGVTHNVNTPADLARLRILTTAPCISTARA
ncbi:MAG: nucleotidyltransferase family protein [Myxococcales bacterium]|nr:nucleotidyltransferase family protein [Myxococcales bacterium]